MKVLVPMGTRPEIVKLTPVVTALRADGFDVRAVATGQHYDAKLTDAFFADLGVWPDERWDLPESEAARLGTLLTLAYQEVSRWLPDLVLVLGDTYTVPAFCLAARRHQIPVAHLEAGLRSFNATSMEEVNRRVAAAVCSFHFAPTEQAARFLQAEGVDPERIRVVGNPVIDSMRARGVNARPLADRAGVVVTAHRATNVDDPERLAAIVDLVVQLADVAGPVTFPVHPRTRVQLHATGGWQLLNRPGIHLRDPVPYDEMLDLVSGCRVVVTDSGGLQEEASWLGVPVVVLRRSTPRWEGVAAGTAVLTGVDVDRAVAAVQRFATFTEQARVAAAVCPYGDGATAGRVVALLRDPVVRPLLHIAEPDFVDREPPQ